LGLRFGRPLGLSSLGKIHASPSATSAKYQMHPCVHFRKWAPHKSLDRPRAVRLYCLPIPMGNVTKKDIVEEIARRTGLTQAETKAVLEGLLDAISTTLRDGKNIEIRGFGRFKVRPRRARTARNPRTGELVQVEGGVKPVFEASRELKALLNTADIALGELEQALEARDSEAANASPAG